MHASHVRQAHRVSVDYDSQPVVLGLEIELETGQFVRVVVHIGAHFVSTYVCSDLVYVER